MGWLYENTPDNSARFVLGVDGTNPLVCFGLNPSTAEPGKLDPTVTRVQKVARLNGFDGFIMLNVYPRRDTNPNDLPAAVDLTLREANQHHIIGTMDGRDLTIYAAWGGIITKRPYLRPLLREILELPAVASSRWVRRGELTAGVHPRHPLYVSTDAPLIAFDSTAYARTL
jgi:hypothetical protein